MAAQPKQNILRDSLKLFSSGALGQIVALLLLVFIGRQYSEEAMGILGSFLAWSGLFAIGIMGRYEQAIVVVPNDREAWGLFRSSIELAIVGTVSLFIFIYLANKFAAYNPLGGYTWWMPLYVLLLAIFSASSMLTLRLKRYGHLAISQGVRTVSNNLLKVLFGLRDASAAMLLLSSALASLLGLMPIIRFAKRIWHEAPPRKARLIALKRHINFLRYSTPQTLINTALASLLILLIPFAYSISEVGILTMSTMLARRPLLVLSESIGQVYFERMSRTVSMRASLWGLIRRPIGLILTIGLVIAISLAFCIEPLVVLFVGDRWLASAEVILWMLPSLIFTFANSIFNVLPDILGRQKSNLYAQVLMLLFELVVIVSGFWLWDFGTFIPYYYSLVFVEQVLYFAFLLSLARRYELNIQL